MLRSPQRMAYHALFPASATALPRLANDQRVIGTDLPGFPGSLHPWGRQLPSHPPSPSIVPGGGLSKDRAPWLPSRDNFFVPVQALSPISRAVCKQEMAKAGRLHRIDPQVWHTNGNVHSQATPHGPTSFTSLAPSVLQVAISTRRIVSLTDRTVTFSSRQPGSVRKRTTQLDAIAFIRRFLQHGLPAGFQTVRHFGLMHPRCAPPTATLRLMILKQLDCAFQPPDLDTPQPFLASWPTWGKPMQLVMRLWPANRVLLDTGCKRPR